MDGGVGVLSVRSWFGESERGVLGRSITINGPRTRDVESQDCVDVVGWEGSSWGHFLSFFFFFCTIIIVRFKWLGLGYYR